MKVAIVTGGNTGIGYEFIIRLKRFNYHIILACRDKARGMEAINNIQNIENKVGKVELMQLDLNNKDSIIEFCNSFKQRDLPLDILVNNAGVSTGSKSLNDEKVDGTVYTNHYGHFLLTQMLLSNLKKNKGRIVNVSSSLFEKAPENIDPLQLDFKKVEISQQNLYALSKKLSLMTYAYLQHEIIKDNQVEIISLCPGFIPTTSLKRNANFVIKFLLDYIFPLLSFTSTLDQGANRMIISATCKLDSLMEPNTKSCALMYSKECFRWVQFDPQQIKQAYLHSLKVVGLNLE